MGISEETLTSEASSLRHELASVVREFGADSGTIHFLDCDGFLCLAETSGLPESMLEAISRIPVGKGMAGLAVERGHPVDACNIQNDSSGDVRPGARASGLSGAIVVPMFRGEEIVGALGIGTRRERRFTDEEARALMEEGRQLAAYADRGAAAWSKA
jgi:L-methionine (R)-S-oxide reductase